MVKILGIKKEMTQVFSNKKVVPVTVVDTETCVVALAVGDRFEVGIGKKRNPNKAEAGKYKELGYVPQYVIITDSVLEGKKVGDSIEASEFIDKKVKITSQSKGKGFQGVVKRWGFAGGPKTHGQSDRLRAPGSIGAGTTPGRVLKGKKMAGRMGGDTITIRNKKIVNAVDSLLLINGSVPGPKGKLVIISMQE